MSIEHIAQISDDDFLDERRWLLAETFFIYRLVLYLRNIFQVPPEGFKSEEEAVKWIERDKNTILYDEADGWLKKGFGNKSRKRQIFEQDALISKSKQKIFKPIYDAIDKYPHLQLEFSFLKLLVFGDKAPFNNILDYIGDNYIYPVWSSQQPITEVGVYIKFSPFLSNKELIKLKQRAGRDYLMMTSTKPLHPNKIPMMKEKRKRKSLSDNAGRYYLQIEEKCINRYINKNPIQLNLFFQELAEELKVTSSIIRNSYYTVRERYGLPSITEASNIPAL